MRKYFFVSFCIFILTIFTYGQNSCVNNIFATYIYFPSETTNQNENNFKLQSNRGEYHFQYSGFTDVYIEYHKKDIKFPKEEYYFPDQYNEIRKLKTNQNTMIPSMKFNLNPFFVSYNGITFVDSIILSQYDTSDIQLHRYIIILTKNYNIEVHFKLPDEFIKTLIYQEPTYFNVYTYILGWNSEIDAIDKFSYKLRVEKKNDLISKKWYDVTNELLSTMKIY